MPSQIKEQFISDLAKELKESPHVVVTQYQGMTAEQFDALRLALRPLGAKYKVVKNRLARIAFDKTGFQGLNQQMKGPSAIAYLGQDGAGLVKALFKFGEQNENFRIKAGHLYGSVTDLNGLKTISTLPSKEVLLAILLARLNGPLTSLVGIMNEPLRSLHAALSAVAKKKETPAAA